MTGWQLSDAHPALVKFFPRLECSKGDSVFVPLCGRTPDMIWLAEQGLNVVGCEISDKAIEDFFSAVGLHPRRQSSDRLTLWQAGPYTLYEGDYFDMTPDQVERIPVIYDRGSLVALPKEGERGRKAYMRQTRKLFGTGTKTLLITLDYDQSLMEGPPYSVDYEEVIWQYSFDHIIEFLSDADILEQEQCFRQRGLAHLTEWVYLMTRYEPVYAGFSDIPTEF